MSQVRAMTEEEKAANDSAFAALERRLWRNMAAAIATAVLGSLLVAPWRVTTGLMLGGILAFLNYHWLRTALASMFTVNDAAYPPTWNGPRYILRYFLVGAIICAASAVNVVSVGAVIAGLCAFAAALMFEGLVQLFSAIFKQEEF